MNPLTATAAEPMIGPYKLHHELGEGAFAKAYLASAPDDDRLVVLKVAHRYDPLVEASVRQEYMFASQLRHPHLGETLDHGVTAVGRPYLVLAYHAGIPLAERPHPLGEAEVARIGVQLARALAAIHAAGMVHRDVTPANVLVDHAGHARLVDFGMLAPVAAAPRSGDGTPLYMAPEALRGEAVDHRADLYSLGVVLYQLAAGMAPFEALPADRLLAAALADAPPPLTAAAPQVSPQLAGLVMALLAKEPGDRPDRARDVANQLARLTGDPMPWVPGPGPFLPPAAWSDWLAEGASPGVEAFVGENGLGRSRCLREAFLHLRRLGAPAVLLAAEEGEGPYGLLERLWRWAAANAPEAYADVPRPLKAVIAALWPWAFPDVAPADDAQRLARVLPQVLALLLRRASSGGPLAIMIDDWDRVDPASQAVLAGGWPNVLREFHWLLTAQAPIKGAESRALYPFDAERAAAWVRAVAETDAVASLASRLYEASHGNPGWMAQALVHLAASGGLGRGTAELPAVPGSVEAMLEATWNRLHPDQRALAEALAVLATPFTQGDLEAFAGQLPATWPLELGALVARGILELSGGRLRFGHGWWAGWIRDRLAPARRARLAAELARALELHHGVTGQEAAIDPAVGNRIAALYAEGDNPEALVKWAGAAGRAAAAIWANGLAVSHFKAGLAAIAAHAEPWRFRAQAQAMRLAMADVQRVMGELAAAEAAYVAAAEEAAQGGAQAGAQAGERVRILTSLGKTRQMLSDFAGARAALEEAIALLAEAPAPAEHVRALSTLGRVLFLTDDREGSHRAYAAMLDLARAHGLRNYAAEALSFLGTLLAGKGETAEQGLAYLTEALAVREAENDPMGQIDTHMLLGNALMGLGRYAAARVHFEADQAIAAEVGYRQEEALAHFNLAMCDMEQGRMRVALERLEAAAALGQETGYVFLVGAVRYAESVARLHTGDLAGMETALGAARDHEAALNSAYLRQYGLVYEAERHLFLGAFDSARRAAELAVASMAKAGGGELLLKARLLLAEARVMGGELAEGEKELAAAREEIERMDAASGRAQALRLAGWLAFKRERLDEARLAWRAALEGARAEALDGLEIAVILALHLVERRTGAGPGAGPDAGTDEAALQRALTLAEAERAPEPLALASLALSLQRLGAGDERAATRLSRRGHDLLARYTAGFASPGQRAAFLGHPARAPFTEIKELEEAHRQMRRERRLEMLLELTQALGASRHPDGALARVQAFTLEVTHAERCLVLLAHGKELRPWGAPADEPYSRSIVDKVVATRRSQALLDTRAEGGLEASASIVDMQLRSVVCVPLLVEHALHGVLYVDSRVSLGAFGPEDVRMVEAIAAQAAVALDNARLIQAMRLQNEQLQSQLRLIEEKETALTALKDYDAARNAAFEAESHDLRAPLGAIMASCQALAKGVEGPLTEAQAGVVDGILLSSRMLARKIDGILDGAGVQAGKLTLRIQDLALGKVVDEIVRGLAPSAEAKGLVLTWDAAAFAALPKVRADERRVGQMVQNLVDNAIKYTDQGVVHVSADTEGGVRLVVTDTGPGFPPARLAAPFERYGARDVRVPGSGVGLWRVKGLMDQHGGTVTIAPGPGRGTAIALVFPVWPSLG